MPETVIPFGIDDEVYYIWERIIKIPCPSCDDGVMIGKDGEPVTCGRCWGDKKIDSPSDCDPQVVGPMKVEKIEITNTGIHVRAGGNWHTADFLFTDMDAAQAAADSRKR